MKAIISKDFDHLKPSEQKRIIETCNKAVEDEVFNRLDDEIVQAQIIWIRMAVINLHQCGIDNDKIIEFLGSWRSIYRANSRIKTEEGQKEWLDKKMKEIFDDDKWVSEYLETLKKI